MDDFPDAFLEKLENAHNYDGRYISAKCPFHDDVRPSFLVYPDKYRCLSCNAYGNTSELLEKLDKTHVYPKKDDKYSWNNPFTKWTKERTLSDILRIANKNLPVRYLKDRGISAEVQSKLHLGLLDGWITFPIFSDTAKVIGAVARAGENNNSRSKYVLPAKQDPNMLYVPDWARIDTQTTLYLTYGILDAVTLYAAGFASASTTTGKRISASAFDNLRKAIVIVPDSGEEPEALRLAAKLGWRGKVLQLDYPDGCKDVNDLVWKAKIPINELKGIIN